MNKLLVGLLVSVGCMSANAANWISQGSNTDGDVAFIDTSSLIWSDYTYTTRSAWVKIYNKKGFSTLSRFFVHCPTRMNAITEIYYYSNNGQFINSVVTNESWDYAMPNSTGEKWARTVCTTNATTR